MREQVVAFARVIEEKLKQNDHKEGWQGLSSYILYSRLVEEVQELKEACINYPEQIVYEAADVAAFAMMLADNSGGLEPYKFNRIAACKMCQIMMLLDQLEAKDLNSIADFARELARLRAAQTSWKEAAQSRGKE